jgi:hypothetical protein
MMKSGVGDRIIRSLRSELLQEPSLSLKRDLETEGGGADVGIWVRNETAGGVLAGVTWDIEVTGIIGKGR